MRTVKLGIEGVAPLRFNNMSESEKEKWKQGAGGGRPPTDQQLDEAAKEKLFCDDQGIYVPSKWIKASLRDAGASLGKKSIKKWVVACVFIKEQKLYVGQPEPDGIHEDIVKRPPKTGTIQRVRWPILNVGWKVACTLEVVDEALPMNSLRYAANYAGLRLGLGDGRPEFGRFRVTNFEISNGAT